MVGALTPLLATLAAAKMDTLDWGVFLAACVAIPVAVYANIRWWRKVRRNELPRDWQSFWLIIIGVACMVSVIAWYLVKFLLPQRQ